MKYKFIVFSFLCLFTFVLIKGKIFFLDQFSVGKIVCSFCPGKKITKNFQVDKILDQPFTYLGKGRQSFVFLSKDQKFVLKFVRQDRLKLPVFIKNPLFSFDLSSIKEQKRTDWLKSYYLAFEKASEITGVIFMQLGEERIHKTISLFDPLGREILFSLDSSEFILQKKVDPLEQKLINLRKRGGYVEIQTLFDSYLDCLCNRLDQQIVNNTRRSIRNMGVLDSKVLEFDIGEWEYNALLNKASNYNKEIDRFTNHFEGWLQKHIPECSVSFNKKKSERKK